MTQPRKLGRICWMCVATWVFSLAFGACFWLVAAWGMVIVFRGGVL